MKTVWLLLFSCCVFSATIAQLRQRETDLSLFAATDTGSCWLMTIKPGIESFFKSHWSVQVLRRISAVNYIIKGNPQQIPSTAIERLLPANDNWKLSPRLLSSSLTTASTCNFIIVSDSLTAIKKKLANEGLHVVILYENSNTLLIKSTYTFLKNILLPDDRIRFIDIADRSPKEEAVVSGFDYTLNRINLLHAAYPLDDGKNIVVSVKENRPDTADIDFKNRYLLTNAAATTLSAHATTMSTIIGGAGNSFYTARGVAPASTLSAASFDILLPNNDAFYLQYHISVQNHSYGTGIENFYGADAAAYDASVNNNTSLLHVFSSGNSGDQASTSGAYAGIIGLANLTGSFKMAKNIITVGSADSFAVVPVLSSKGPAYDGRVKPELVAYGEDGSSGAAALVSGTAAVLQSIYKKQHADSLPDASLVKAILLNSATDIGNEAIDFYSGYGNLDAYRAATVMKADSFFSGTIAQSQSNTFNINLPANAKNLKILLCWTDPAANANAFTALVNDLDLTVTHTADGQQWLPWLLSNSANKDSLQLLALRRRDSLNVVEQVTIEEPPAGNYSIHISGYSIPAGTQKFFVVYQWDTANAFRWNFPTGADNFIPNKSQFPRWSSNANTTGQLEYSIAGSNTWRTISNAVDLSQQFSNWLTPDTTAVAILRMTINGQPFLSDSFTISAPLQTGVGFNCADNFLLYWNRLYVNRYQVNQLGTQYMEPFQQTADTILTINKNTTSSRWFSIAPLLTFNKTGISSFAFDYSTQGVDCYFKNFTADLFSNTSSLVLTLGTSYHVTGISIEKADQSGAYHLLKTFTNPFQLQYSATDSMLVQGINQYRARIVLQTGEIIYSDVQSVYSLGHHTYLIYPNPIKRPQPFTILTDHLSNPVFQLFNSYGQKAMEKKLFNLSEQITTAQLAKGVYFYVITEDGNKKTTGKLIVQ